MRGLLSGWNIMRFLRLVLGLILIVQGVNNGETLYFVLGGALALMALANVGSCGAKGCEVRPRRVNQKEEKQIVYEEVDPTK